MKRIDGRRADELRPISLERRVLTHAQGSAIVSYGKTKVLCAVMVEDGVPSFLKNTGKGWLTADYAMMPYATPSHIPRQNEPRARSQEIRRLIGRSLRAVVDLTKIPDKTLWVDCDVLQADGGTRCAAITGAFVSLLEADNWLQRKHITADTVVRQFCGAVSVGLVESHPLLDLTFHEDSRAQVDMNLVMTDKQEFVELQLSGEEYTVSSPTLQELIALGKSGIARLTEQIRHQL